MQIKTIYTYSIKFVEGCSRDVIRQGAENLSCELDTLFEKTILAMRESEDKIEEKMKNIKKTPIFRWDKRYIFLT